MSANEKFILVLILRKQQLVYPLSPGPFPLKGEGEISEKQGICGSEATANTLFFGFLPPPRLRGGGKGVGVLAG
jgi:hypothetical protein